MYMYIYCIATENKLLKGIAEKITKNSKKKYFIIIKTGSMYTM